MKNKVNQLLVAIIALLVIALVVLGLQLLDSKDSTESNQDYSGTSLHSSDIQQGSLIVEGEDKLSDEEIQADSIIWAGNKSKKDGTRFGIKIEGDKMFRIAMNKGNTFVYLDSASPNTLESFLGQQKDEIEQEYDTDTEYGDDGRDYDD